MSDVGPHNDRHVYPTDTNYKNHKAYVCGKGYCDDGTIIAVDSLHFYAGNVVQGSEYPSFFKCKQGFDDKWLLVTSGDISKCNGSHGSSGVGYEGNYYIWGKKQKNVYVDVCKTEVESYNGVKCTANKQGKTYIMDDVYVFYCDKGEWGTRDIRVALCATKPNGWFKYSVEKNHLVFYTKYKLPAEVDLSNMCWFCEDGYIWDSNAETCVVDSKKATTQKPAKQSAPAKQNVQKPKQQKTTNIEQKPVNVVRHFTSGCKLEFNDGSVLEDIDTAYTRYGDGLNENSDTLYFVFQNSNGDNIALHDVKEYEKLTKVNGVPIRLPVFYSRTMTAIYFKCDKWNNDNYFAFACNDGYEAGNKIDEVSGVNLYEKCVMEKEGGCELEFKNKVLKNINTAIWDSDGGTRFREIEPDEFVAGKPLEDLVSVNNEPVDVELDTETTEGVYFKCDKWDDNYFAFDCKDEYRAGNVVGTDEEDDTDLYDECIKEKIEEKPQQQTIKVAQTVPAKKDDNAVAIANAKKVLDDFYTYAKDDKNRSVWKNSEGNFNTIRLASDLTAGVVLGTVGGVVSGVVIKKKQVEKGFDALHCAVGGQAVADWGDEFSVGFYK